MTDISHIRSIKCTSEFLTWVNKLDRSLKIRIDQRIQRLTHGNPGFHKRFDKLLEIKWTTGAMGSFRVYCTEQKGVILLIGGHKDKQSSDIKLALNILKGIENGKTRIKKYE